MISFAVRIPVVSYQNDDTMPRPVANAKSRTLQLLQCPASLTFAMLDEYVVADPTCEEEDLTNSQFTIVYNDKGKLLAVWKPGGVALPEDKLRECMNRTKERVEEVMRILEKITVQS